MLLGGLVFRFWTWIPSLTESERRRAVNQKGSLFFKQTPADVPAFLPLLVQLAELGRAHRHCPGTTRLHQQPHTCRCSRKLLQLEKKYVKTMIVALMQTLMYIRQVRIVFNNHVLPSFPWDCGGTLGRIWGMEKIHGILSNCGQRGLNRWQELISVLMEDRGRIRGPWRTGANVGTYERGMNESVTPLWC